MNKLLLPTAVLCLSVLAAAVSAQSTQKPEPWADTALPVTDGLYVWLDASRIDPGRKALQLASVKESDRIDLWPDASGHRRHLLQTLAESRPTYVTADSFHALRFDGSRTYLSRLELSQSAEAVTVFLVAAPTSNSGMFVGPLALSAAESNDYVSGLNIDQGPQFSQRIEVLNVEGAGTRGATNLLKSKKIPFGEVLRISLASAPGGSGIAAWLNGQPQATRDRTSDSVVQLERMVVGARFYNNAGPPDVRGFFQGEIAEVIVYDRSLNEAERTEVETYLAKKYGTVPTRPSDQPVQGKPLVAVENPPAVQFFVPGFVARRLPIELTNVNNLLYRTDGRLIGLGYDGNIHLLSDRDEDGLEDEAELFWKNSGQLQAPIGMALTPPGYALGQGVFVAAKGKCLLIADTDGDDKADREIVVAQGWQEIPHGVDALGVAVDPKDNSVLLGIGTKNFTNPYGHGAGDASIYPLDSERGTILRIAPDFKTRAIFATGIRFPVSLRFNSKGDLFCSDQEGATWLANGNPLDELLHVERGRHYGFPPRHPQYLPNVIDEPSLFDYWPQHQSTCGMNFNEPGTTSGAVFGPDWWRSDLFVAGYSRGKLYRTKLVTTSAGYVAQNQLVACTTMLACDVCVSPRGDLVVATHSGGPDWGSGPSGKGALVQIRYRDRDLPQPALIWAQSPQEVRVTFDRPLEPSTLAGLQNGAKIEYGRYVAAGDRFESLRPGYQVVQDQLRSPREELAIYNVQLSSDRSTLILSTAPHATAASYALTLPGFGRREEPQDQDFAQHPVTDLQYSLGGVEVSWKPSSGSQEWHGWLPHLDLSAARQLTSMSAEHRRLWSLMERSGTLTLRTALMLENMLRPNIQPGGKIDYQWPTEQVTLTLRSSQRLVAKVDGKLVESTARASGEQVLSIATAAGNRIPLELTLISSLPNVGLDVSWSTNEDPRPRALPLHRMTLPWSRVSEEPVQQVIASDLPELKGGNWERGKRIFLSDQVGCSKCHTFSGAGGGIGPDLTNLPHRDYQSVLRDIQQPSYAINPDFIAQTVVLSDGHVVTGTVRTRGQQLTIGDGQGRMIQVELDDIDQIQSSTLSVMPEGLLEKLGPASTRDLLTFLLTRPPSMPEYAALKPPPARSRAEVEAVLAGAPEETDARKKLSIVLVTGRKDHGPGEHDYPAWQQVWQQLLSMSDATAVEVAADWPSKEQLQKADVLVFYQQGTWNANRAADLDAYFQRGGGAVYIHYAVDGGSDPLGFSERIGLAWKGGHSKFRHGELDMNFAPADDHPIARNFDKLHLHDESYWQLLGQPQQVQLLATGIEDNRDQPLFWSKEQGQGRVFVSIPGHFSWSFDDPLFRVLLLRGIAWSGKAPVDQFNELVTPGARIE